MSDLSQPVRAGFWRRGFALVIDTLIVSIVVTVVGIPLSLLTDGRVRVGDAIINTTACHKLDRSYSEIRLPKDFKPTSAVRCARSTLGHTYDWFLFVQQKTVSGAITYEKNLTFILDRDGNVVSAFYLDQLSLILLVIMIFIQELKRRDTSGKRTVRLRVQSLGRGTPNRKQVGIRLLRFVFLIPLEIAFLLLTSFGVASDFDYSYILYLSGLSTVLAIITIGEFVWASRHGRPPFYDRWAGTEVVKIGS